MLKRFGFVVPWLAILASLGSGTAAAQQAPPAAAPVAQTAPPAGQAPPAARRRYPRLWARLLRRCKRRLLPRERVSR